MIINIILTECIATPRHRNENRLRSHISLRIAIRKNKNKSFHKHLNIPYTACTSGRSSTPFWVTKRPCPDLWQRRRRSEVSRTRRRGRVPPDYIILYTPHAGHACIRMAICNIAVHLYRSRRGKRNKKRFNIIIYTIKQASNKILCTQVLQARML